MASPPAPSPTDQLAWHALTGKVQELERQTAGISGWCHMHADDVSSLSQRIEVLAQILRATRNESPEQFALTCSQALRALTAPPEAEDMAALKREMAEMQAEHTREIARLSAAMKEAVYAMQRPAETPTLPVETTSRKKRGKVAPKPVAPPAEPVVNPARGSVDPSQFKPAVLVACPPLESEEQEEAARRRALELSPETKRAMRNMQFGEGG